MGPGGRKRTPLEHATHQIMYPRGVGESDLRPKNVKIKRAQIQLRALELEIEKAEREYGYKCHAALYLAVNRP